MKCWKNDFETEIKLNLAKSLIHKVCKRSIAKNSQIMPFYRNIGNQRSYIVPLCDDLHQMLLFQVSCLHLVDNHIHKRRLKLPDLPPSRSPFHQTHFYMWLFQKASPFYKGKNLLGQTLSWRNFGLYSEIVSFPKWLTNNDHQTTEAIIKDLRGCL